MHQITMGTLCSGIGAPEVAAERLGWQTLFCSEIAPYARKILAARFGAGVGNGPRLFDDFTATPVDDYPSVDVLVAGTPCQAFSVAGNRKSLDDARGNLTLQLIEYAHGLAARPVRPLRNLIWENVPGCLNTFDNAFGCFLAGLVGADAPICPPGAVWGKVDPDTGTTGWESCGFPSSGMVQGPRGRAAWRVLNSQYFGLAQRRNRVFVIADFGNGADPASVLFERRGRDGDFTPGADPGEDFADDVEAGAGVDGFPTAAGTLRAGRGGADAHISALIPDVAWALQERDAKGADSNTKVGHLIPVAFSMRGRDGGNMPEPEPGDVAPALRTDGGGSSLPFVAYGQPIAFSSKDFGQDATADLSPTLRAGNFTESHANGGVPPAVALSSAVGYAVRRLTPTECERLQGFPDGFTQLAPDSPFTGRYSTLGNAMSVDVIHWIMRRTGEQLAAIDAK